MPLTTAGSGGSVKILGNKYNPAMDYNLYNPVWGGVGGCNSICCYMQSDSASVFLVPDPIKCNGYFNTLLYRRYTTVVQRDKLDRIYGCPV